VEYRPSFVLQTHSTILDGFAQETQKLFREIRALVPEASVNEKPSVSKRIKAARQAHDATQETAPQLPHKSKGDPER
jgi:hypothetical protein